MFTKAYARHASRCMAGEGVVANLGNPELAVAVPEEAAVLLAWGCLWSSEGELSASTARGKTGGL